jgi:hypothetical protein
MGQLHLGSRFALQLAPQGKDNHRLLPAFISRKFTIRIDFSFTARQWPAGLVSPYLSASLVFELRAKGFKMSSQGLNNAKPGSLGNDSQAWAAT